MGRQGRQSSVGGERAGKPQERVYCTMECGNCFRSPWASPESRFFSCTTCGSPAYECERCVRVAAERDFAAVTTCAYCSLAEEANAEGPFAN
jgi:hypothetical protein